MQVSGMFLYRPKDVVVGQVCQVDRKIYTYIFSSFLMIGSQ
jgi:hypothetical protein